MCVPYDASTAALLVVVCDATALELDEAAVGVVFIRSHRFRVVPCTCLALWTGAFRSVAMKRSGLA